MKTIKITLLKPEMQPWEGKPGRKIQGGRGLARIEANLSEHAKALSGNRKVSKQRKQR